MCSLQKVIFEFSRCYTKFARFLHMFLDVWRRGTNPKGRKIGLGFLSTPNFCFPCRRNVLGTPLWVKYVTEPGVGLPSCFACIFDIDLRRISETTSKNQFPDVNNKNRLYLASNKPMIGLVSSCISCESKSFFLGLLHKFCWESHPELMVFRGTSAKISLKISDPE